MPKNRPGTSGYARLTQEDDDQEEYEHDDPNTGQRTVSVAGSQYAPIQPGRRAERMSNSGRNSPSRRRPGQLGKRQRNNSGVDIKAINARLEKWAEEIAHKFKIKRGRGVSLDEGPPEIQHSVFQAPDWIRPATAKQLSTEYVDAPGERMSKVEFDDIIESVRVAIELGTHPKLISQGSSGSYFARNSSGKTVGVFKPKDEEPYASKNPKWTKWIHRNLFPCFFGRACLIPNLSYVSEAAAYVLDVQLRTNIVPYTDVVSLSSKSFSYDFWDRRAYYRKKKPLPEKPGSFQVFLKGFKDATLFLKENPWPDQNNASFNLDTNIRRKKKRRWTDDCRPRGPPSDDEDDERDSEDTAVDEGERRRTFWSDGLQQSFREQLEKLVILDYIMRNTDRGLDNWMIRIDEETQTASIIAEPPKMTTEEWAEGPRPVAVQNKTELEPYQRNEQMMVTSRSATPQARRVVRLGAIDNSLSWPWKHPDAWRSYPFGWLFLPVSLIGQPFSEATRRHFLPLLTSKAWWSETQLELRKCFMQDADFKERMYDKQIAVMKGQAWNVVETLKTPDHGPLELTRRARVHVWDDLVDVPVAVPLRAPFDDVRSYDARKSHEGSDLGAAHQSAAPSTLDPLRGVSPNAEELTSGTRFNISRQSSANDVRPTGTSGALSPDNAKALAGDSSATRDAGYFSARPSNKTRVSFDEPRRNKPKKPHKRRLSLTARNTTGHLGMLDEDDEGDLGYAANEDREMIRKRVIVERLEPVKAGNPVFTWC